MCVYIYSTGDWDNEPGTSEYFTSQPLTFHSRAGRRGVAHGTYSCAAAGGARQEKVALVSNLSGREEMHIKVSLLLFP